MQQLIRKAGTMFTRLIAAAAVTFALASAAVAQTDSTAKAEAPAKAKKELHYLTAAELNPAALLPAPPADGTDEQKAGVAETLAIQTAASAARKEKAVWDDRNEDNTIWEHYLGPDFSLAKLPLTAALLKEAQEEGDVAAGLAKKHFDRLRPWAFNESISVCEAKGREGNKTKAYPTGHATFGYTTGVILANLWPERAAEIMATAKDYGFSRVVCGAHYVSDTVASEVVGTVTAQLLLHNAAFKPKFDAARAEMIAAGLTK
jgi:acid phosphatase (class A)